MTVSQVRSPVKTIMWLLSGLVVGGMLSAGLVLVAAGTIRGDAPTTSLGPPHFTETPTSGVDHTYDGEFQYFVGGGVAVFDCNADLLPDMYVAGGTDPAALYVNRSDRGGALAFEQRAGPETGLASVTGAYPIDIDSDGVTDLAVLRVGQNILLRGLGDCRFEPANQRWGVTGGDDWTAAFSAVWEQGEAFPTMAFGNYLALDALDDRDECETHDLVRPDGAGYSEPTTLSPGWCTLSILFSDWGRTGERDLRMTNDRHYYTDGEDQMWRVAHGEPPRLYTSSDGWQAMQIWGMGIASHDVTGDGLPEVFLTSQGDNKLQTLADGSSEPNYEDMALAAGATAHRPFMGDTNRPSTAWHAEFGDVNNDGFTDLFVTKGNVDSQVGFATEDPNNLLLGRPDGTFEESAADAGILDYSLSRGGAMVDLNLDGLLDLVVVERREPVKIWRNEGTGESANWIGVDLQQPAPNVDAIGSWVEVKIGSATLQSEVTIGGGHASGELVPIHFGLGNAEGVEIRVIWPDGEVGSWHHVDANQIVSVDRASGTASSLFALQD